MFAFTENEEDLSPQVTQPVKKKYIYKKNPWFRKLHMQICTHKNTCIF